MALLFTSFARQSAPPVAGLGAAQAQSIIFAIQQCVREPEDEDVAKVWLQALQLAQCLHERLLGDLQRVESTLAFWQRQLQRGSHVRFMLFQRGPVHFAAHVGMGLKALLALLSPPGLSSQQRRDEEDDDEGGAAPPRGRPPDRSQAVERTTSVGPGGARSLSSATTRMQRRVLLLEALRNILAETLAQVSATARLLWLNHHLPAGAPGAAPLPGAVGDEVQAGPVQGLSTIHPFSSGRLGGGAGPGNGAVGATPGLGPRHHSAPPPSNVMLQSAREAVQQVTSELTQLVTGPLGLHERLQHLQVEEGCSGLLREAAMHRVMSGCATMPRTHAAAANAAQRPSLQRLLSTAPTLHSAAAAAAAGAGAGAAGGGLLFGAGTGGRRAGPGVLTHTFSLAPHAALLTPQHGGGHYAASVTAGHAGLTVRTHAAGASGGGRPPLSLGIPKVATPVAPLSASLQHSPSAAGAAAAAAAAGGPLGSAGGGPAPGVPQGGTAAGAADAAGGGEGGVALALDQVHTNPLADDEAADAGHGTGAALELDSQDALAAGEAAARGGVDAPLAAAAVAPSSPGAHHPSVSSPGAGAGSAGGGLPAALARHSVTTGIGRGGTPSSPSASSFVAPLPADAPPPAGALRGSSFGPFHAASAGQQGRGDGAAAPFAWQRQPSRERERDGTSGGAGVAHTWHLQRSLRRLETAMRVSLFARRAAATTAAASSSSHDGAAPPAARRPPSGRSSGDGARPLHPARSAQHDEPGGGAEAAAAVPPGPLRLASLHVPSDDEDLPQSPLLVGARALWQAVENACEELDGQALVAALTAPLTSQPHGAAPGGASQQHRLGRAPRASQAGGGEGAGGEVPRRRKRAVLRAALALEHASQVARRAGPLVAVPEWARMPNWWQRNWVACTAAGVLGLWGARWVWKHSPAGGSDDLVRWSRAAWLTVSGSAQAHVIDPLRGLHEELTRTLRERPSIVSQQEYEGDLNSLARMLADFERDVKPRAGKHTHPPSSSSSAAAAAAAAKGTAAAVAAPAGVAEAGGEAGALAPAPSLGPTAVPSLPEGVDQGALERGMNLVMASYEAELRDPLRNLLVGQLARSLLIQIQRLKLDTEAAMLELDQILKANELTMSLVAAIPAIALMWGTLAALARWAVPRGPDAKRAAVPCRMALASLERALHRLADQEEALLASAAAGAANAATSAASPSAQGEGPWGALAAVAQGPGASAVVHTSDAWLSAASPSGVLGWLDAEGMALYEIYKLYREAVALFVGVDTLSRHSEWPQLSADLAELTVAVGAAARLRVVDRMQRAYKVFQR